MKNNIELPTKSKMRNTIATILLSFVIFLLFILTLEIVLRTTHLLNENYKFTVELMNFGRSGYTQTEELLVLKNHVAQFFPDMVILFFLPANDIGDVSKETATGVLRPFFNISQKGELILV